MAASDNFLYLAAGVSCDGSTSFTSIQAFDLSQPEKDAVVLQEGLCASEFGMWNVTVVSFNVQTLYKIKIANVSSATYCTWT